MKVAEWAWLDTADAVPPVLLLAAEDTPAYDDRASDGAWLTAVGALPGLLASATLDGMAASEPGPALREVIGMPDEIEDTLLPLARTSSPEDLRDKVKRRGIVAIDGGCRFLGCDRPAAWAQIHHIRFWEHDGPTRPSPPAPATPADPNDEHRDPARLSLHILHTSLHYPRIGWRVLPIFKSENQFRLLGELFTAPAAAEFTVSELAARAGVTVSTTSREVSSLARAGLVRVTSRGNQRVITVDDDQPTAPDLRSLLRKLYGPIPAIRVALADVDGIDRAFIFGSYARALTTPDSPAPRDIDLLVLGDVDVDAVWTAAAHLSRDLGIEVNPVVRATREWEDDPTGFARSVKDGPLLDVEVAR